MIRLSNVPFAAAHFQAWRCFAITTENIRNRQSIAIIVGQTIRAMVITDVNVKRIIQSVNKNKEGKFMLLGLIVLSVVLVIAALFLTVKSFKKPKNLELHSPIKKSDIESVKSRGLKYIEKLAEDEPYVEEKVAEILSKINSLQDIKQSEFNYLTARWYRYKESLKQKQIADKKKINTD